MALLQVTWAAAILSKLGQSDCEYTLKPPFRENICNDQTRESPLSGIFEKFATGHEEQISQVYENYADCVSDDFVSDYGGRHKDGEWDEESVIDQAFLSLFDELSMVPDTMHISCANSYTIEYSMDMSARMKGIDKPFGYKMRFQIEYNDDGLIKKMTDQTPFHRNVVRNFYTLMDGEIGDDSSDSSDSGDDQKFGDDGGITPRYRPPPGYERTYDDKKVEDNLDDHKGDLEESGNRNRDKKAVCVHYSNADMEDCHDDCEMEDMGCGHCTILDNWCWRKYEKRQPRIDDHDDGDIDNYLG